MKLHEFNHINIGCRQRDLAALEKFYGDALGLKRGFRPEFPNGGLWLYLGERAIIHVVARYPDGWTSRDPHTTSFDHIAFTITGAAEFRARLTGLGIAFDEQNVPNAGYQIFLRDPVGNTPEQHATYIKTEIEKWQKVATDAGITPE
jgi:catechol 2,3-dioxygenase-like lactoylglutathione lyase family enzyme